MYPSFLPKGSMSPTKKNKESTSTRKPFKASTEVSTSKYSSADYIASPELMQEWHGSMKDTRGVHRMTSLFFEARRNTDVEEYLKPIFTLKTADYTTNGVTYFCLREIYFSYDHIPNFEYEFAMDVFGSWDHWVKLTKSALRHEFQLWRDELEVKIKAQAIKSMMYASRDGDAKGVAAAKYLADKGYTQERKAGRPSREEVERERKIAVEVQNTLAADMERVGLSVAK